MDVLLVETEIFRVLLPYVLKVVAEPVGEQIDVVSFAKDKPILKLVFVEVRKVYANLLSLGFYSSFETEREPVLLGVVS